MPSATGFLRHLPANEYRRLRWQNGLGWTREIHAGQGGGAEGWDWRLSIAEIEADGAYSIFPGVEREQILLSGEGLALVFADGRTAGLAPPHGRLRFDGGAEVRAQLQGGRVEVFNLMWRPKRVAPRLWHRPLVGTMLLFPDPGSIWALHLVAGRATVGGEGRSILLEQGDSALLAAGNARRRQVVEGSGELLLLRIDPAVADQ